MGDAATNRKDQHIFRSRFPAVPVPEGVTLPEFVLEGAEGYADNVALVEAATGASYTYGEVARDTRRFAKALRSLGLRKGHVVVVVLPNVAVYPAVALGIMAAGGVFSGANPLALPAEIRKQVEDSDAKLIVTNKLIHDKVKDFGVPIILVGRGGGGGGEVEGEGEDDAPDQESAPSGTIQWAELLDAADRAGAETAVSASVVSQRDLCALPYSSGTTGTSKGVMLSHGNLVANLSSSLFAVPRDAAVGVGVDGVTILGLMPFFHIYGLTGIVCSTLRSRGKVVVMDRFDPCTFMAGLARHRVHFAPLVPAVMLAMVNAPPSLLPDPSAPLALRSVMTAAAPLAPDLLAAFQRRFPDVQVQEAYGLTEHSCITLTHGDPSRRHAKKNSVGFILPNLEVKFVDPDTGRSLPKNTPGEVCVRSQCVMQGYYKNREETERTIDDEGWLRTGDIGYIDDDGDVFIIDRIKELIKYKGFQVAPAEIEALLLSHPSVEDAAVFGLPDEEAGEVPAACVVMRAEAKETEQEIMKFVASNVASYKRVRVLHFIQSIPKSPSGKIMRRLLRDGLSEKKASDLTIKGCENHFP
ncbi:4-coumarate--CoA ligase-like 9 [Ananas comosus]|uniref:4-coumarate--CoA ligase n=1 Tax=Ananas comosus TaxID=4615 RepID=A0A6P5F2C4_ANACO|nr:4-coumarate--CoA ligase-like 9 [Ananas comosus]